MPGYTYTPTDVLLYEAVFLHFRNAVVAHVRSCLMVEHGDQAVEKMRKSLGQDTWDALVDNAMASAARGAVIREREDDFDYLDIGVFRQLIEHHYETLVPDRWRGLHAKASKSQLVQWTQEVKNARDPAAHPGSREIDPSDAIRAVDAAVRALRRLETAAGVAELEVILSELYERAARPLELGSVAPLDDTLPSAETVVQEFVGRGNELAQLRAWLSHPRRNRWMLVGDGGKGKSAIAYAFATEVLETAPTSLCGAFWLSAKRRRYATDKVVDIPTPDFSTLDECLDRILLDYGDLASQELPLPDKQEQVVALLNELPVLLVIDDLDSVDEEREDVVEFVTLEAPATASKVLLTSRRKFAGMGASATQILGLAEPDAIEFIDTRWRATGLDSADLSTENRKGIVDACEGSPLYMGDLIRLIAAALRKGQSEVTKVIADWKSHDGNEVRQYALQREMDMLSSGARRALEGLALTGRPMTIVELARVLAMGELVVAGATDELQQLYLVSAPSLDDETPRFAIDGNLAVLVRSELRGSPREAQLQNALDAIEGKDPSASQAAVTRDTARQARLLLNAGRTVEAEQVLNRQLDESPDDAHLLAMLGMAYVAWKPRRTVDARAQFARAADLGYKDRGMFLAWARIEGERGDWNRAVHAAARGLAVRESDPMLQFAAARAHRSLAKQHLRALSTGKASASFEEADVLFEEAITTARKLRLRANDISPMYEGWVLNARDQVRPKAECYRLKQWQKWRPRDVRCKPILIEHAKECPSGEHR
ncbi:AAA family ATPase [Rothia sp. ARF10]|nr:AAA family ATPase [Rothia sp. ARF10]